MNRSFFANARFRIFFTTGSFSSAALVHALRKRSLTFVCNLGWWLRIWVSPLCPLQQQTFAILGSFIVLLPISMVMVPSKRFWCGVEKASLPWFRNFLPLHVKCWGSIHILRQKCKLLRKVQGIASST